MRLNLGCGRQVLDGWFNIDVVAHPKARRAPDLFADLRDIALPDACADEAMAVHVIEHFYQWEVPAVLTEWRRLLKPGARLILELPDLAKACRNILAGEPDQMGMWGLYGDPGTRDPYMCHRWGWTGPHLSRELLLAGFVNPRVLPPQYHGQKRNRDMRVEAEKPHGQ